MESVEREAGYDPIALAAAPGGQEALTRTPIASPRSRSDSMGKVTLTGKGRRWYLRGHPWIYKDDVASAEATPGELVPVEDPNGAPLGWGLFSSESRIRVRMVTREAEQPNRAFWSGRLERAVGHRERLGLMDPAAKLQVRLLVAKPIISHGEEPGKGRP